jgi:hypothetical protein
LPTGRFLARPLPKRSSGHEHNCRTIAAGDFVPRKVRSNRVNCQIYEAPETSAKADLFLGCHQPFSHCRASKLGDRARDGSLARGTQPLPCAFFRCCERWFCVRRRAVSALMLTHPTS